MVNLSNLFVDWLLDLGHQTRYGYHLVYRLIGQDYPEKAIHSIAMNRVQMWVCMEISADVTVISLHCKIQSNTINSCLGQFQATADLLSAIISKTKKFAYFGLFERGKTTPQKCSHLESRFSHLIFHCYLPVCSQYASLRYVTIQQEFLLFQIDTLFAYWFKIWQI